MTEIDTEEEQPGSKVITEEKTAISNKNDGRNLSERAESTEARQARKPSVDEDLFDNMPI